MKSQMYFWAFFGYKVPKNTLFSIYVSFLIFPRDKITNAFFGPIFTFWEQV